MCLWIINARRSFFHKKEYGTLFNPANWRKVTYLQYSINHIPKWTHCYRWHFRDKDHVTELVANKLNNRRSTLNKWKMTTWNTISPRCWLVAMWWHHFATFDDIILQHLMTSFWMTCTFWILNKQVKNSFLKLCTIFHRSSLDLDLDVV